MKENRTLTLGSLFDGSGGFPLGGMLCGIRPLWASEIDPFCIRVTSRRFPEMKHLGDISDIDGAAIEPVDIITFGSPCQDLSIAGTRSGLDGQRSGLFHEAIRIIRQMRESTEGEYPRCIVWENVPGAFSSNGGADFRAVIQEIADVRYNGQVSVPQPEKWNSSGLIVEDDFSLAWRVLDAQYWGVPQRRKRIYLVADFAGKCAGKILFESEGLPGDPAQGIFKRKGTAGGAEESAHISGIGIDGYNGIVSKEASALGENCGMSIGRNGVMVLNDQGGETISVSEDISSTLRAQSLGHEPSVLAVDNHPADSRVTISDDGTCQTLTGRMGTGGGNVPMLLKIRCGQEGGSKDPLVQYDRSAALTCSNDQTLFETKVYGICSKTSGAMMSDNPNTGFYEAKTTRTLDANGGNPCCNQGGMAVLEGNGSRPSHKGDGYKESEVMYTLNSTEHHALAYGIDRAAFNQGRNAKFGIAVDKERESALVARGPNAVAEPVCSASKSSHFTYASIGTAGTLAASDCKDPPIINDGNADGTKYIVRRLTPTECAMLQGFPGWWCEDIETDNPSEDDIKHWREIFLTFAKATGKIEKPKSDSQIIKWLQHPHSDAAEYRMWGNGVALPCVIQVLYGIAYHAGQHFQ